MGPRPLAKVTSEVSGTSGKTQNVAGLLVVDKPSGCTSHDVVARLRKGLGIRKIGHAGTLDPDATGILPVCAGPATRIVEYLMELPKAYRVRMKLGEETDTEDASGRVTRRHGLKGLTEERVRAAVMRFLGEVRQVPPMYSALKSKGRRLYDLARKGEEVSRPPRTVNLYEIHGFQCDLPHVFFHVRCSKGTYIRSLCRDIGRELGVGAHLTDLRRTESAGFTEKDAHPLSEILAMGRDKGRALFVPMDVPLGHFPAAVVHSGKILKVRQGRPLEEEDLLRRPEGLKPGDLLRLYGEDGAFLAIGRTGTPTGGGLRILPRKVFL